MSEFTKSEWEYWKHEKYPYYYVGQVGSQKFLATVDKEDNARLIAAAPEMCKLIHTLASLPDEQCMISPLITKARKLVARIDGSEAQS